MGAAVPFGPPPTVRPRSAAAALAPTEEPYRSLAALSGAIERMAAAVIRHDAAVLEAATVEAADLVGRIERLAADGVALRTGPGDDRALDELLDRLAAGARLAAHLIERAWASEAAAIQLLARCLGRDAGSAYAASRMPRSGGAAGAGPTVDEPLLLERRA